MSSSVKHRTWSIVFGLLKKPNPIPTGLEKSRVPLLFFSFVCKARATKLGKLVVMDKVYQKIHSQAHSDCDVIDNDVIMLKPLLICGKIQKIYMKNGFFTCSKCRIKTKFGTQIAHTKPV